MRLKNAIAIQEIAALIGAEIIGDDQIEITSINEIHKVVPGSITFVDHPKYLSRAVYSQATAVIVNQRADCPEGKALLLCDSPFEAYNSLAKRYCPFTAMTAQVSDSAKIGANTIIEANVVIGEHVEIGDNCLIRANTVIAERSKIGDNVIIHANCSIGGDAFYFKRHKDASYERWHSIGRVVIEDNVEIGSSCTIDKGVSGDTCLGAGTKLDNQVHIAHGVVIGKNCLIAAQVGIAGKTIIQDNVTLYGQVGISKSLVVGEGATVFAQSGVSKSLPGGKQYFGSPASPRLTHFRELAALRQLPELLRQVKGADFMKNNEENTGGSLEELSLNE